MKIKSLKQLRKANSSCVLYEGDDIKANIWPEGLVLYQIYEKYRQGRIACSRKDLSLKELKSHLPLIVLHDVLADNQRLQVRVMGTEFAETLGFDATGKFVDELPNTDYLVDRCRWSTHHCKPLLSVGVKLTYSHYSYKSYDSILLPLIDDQNEVNMLLTYSNFK